MIKQLLKGCLYIFATVFMFSLSVGFVAGLFFNDDKEEKEPVATEAVVPLAADTLQKDKEPQLKK